MRHIFIAALFLLMPPFAVADDWPMYRRDAGRTGVATDALGDDLQLAWVRELPPLKPAFHNARLQFDAGYEPVAVDGKLLIGSSQNDSLKAFDSATGDLIWSFYTNGPIRFAPAVWKNSVCVGSDDGFLYCLDLTTGEVRWKHRAAPSDRRLLGNRRLISVWPVRGGPVVAEGRVYFAAGVWPFEGVFVYAMDIATGKVVWRNDRLGYLFGQQPHNTEAIGGLAPQGYLVIDGDELIVPCSTAYPARLNRQTGKLIEFKLPSPGRLPGGWFAAIEPDKAKAIRRGKLTFDDVVNRQQHEDKVHVGRGDPGVSRRIRAGKRTLSFDDGFPGVEGTIHSMITCDERLFVVTRSGNIYCFDQSDATASTSSNKKSPKTWPLEKTKITASSEASRRARQLVASASSQHGLAFVVGLTDGDVVKGLLAESKYHVIAIDDDAARVNELRAMLDLAGEYGGRAAVIEAKLDSLTLPPYLATVLTTERVGKDWTSLLPALRPHGGVAEIGHVPNDALAIKPGGFELETVAERTIVRRAGPLPGSSEYAGDWKASSDQLVRFPLGVLWYDDTLSHFKRSPQPQFTSGVMISRPKDWRAPRVPGNYKVDYPLLPPILSDIYTGRIMDETEMTGLRSTLKATDPKKHEPSQYRPPRQKDAWKPSQPVAGERRNPLTGELEPRAFPKTYGCDGGFDYGDFYTLRSGTAAFYDKTVESGTVFLSGPRSGCTNSVIPAGGLLNVPYFFEGCTCSYPLPSAMSLVAMPEAHEQWSSWGATAIKPKSIERIGLNFGAPGDRITRSGTLWLDFPSVGGPSPQVNIVAEPAKPTSLYRHSGWMAAGEPYPWVSASAVEGLKRLVIQDLKPGKYTVRMVFAELENREVGERRQTLKLQGKVALSDFDSRSVAGATMKGVTREATGIVVTDEGTLSVQLEAAGGKTLISGLELIRE